MEERNTRNEGHIGNTEPPCATKEEMELMYDWERTKLCEKGGGARDVDRRTAGMQERLDSLGGKLTLNKYLEQIQIIEMINSVAKPKTNANSKR